MGMGIFLVAGVGSEGRNEKLWNTMNILKVTEKVLEIESGNDYITVWMFLMQLNYIPKNDYNGKLDNKK